MGSGVVNLTTLRPKASKEVEEAIVQLHSRVDNAVVAINNLSQQLQNLPTQADLQSHAARIEQASSVFSIFDYMVAGVSSGSKQQASTLPTVNGAFAYTANASTIIWYWDGTNGSSPITIFWPDGSSTIVPPASFAVSGLAASTTYTFYPYFDVNLGGVNFVILATGNGSPKAAFIGSSQLAAAAQSADNRVGMTANTITASTTAGAPAGGSGGGSGGGCVSEDCEVIPLAGKALSYLMPCEDWIEIKTFGGHKLRGAPKHRIFTEDGCLALLNLSVGMRVVSLDGLSIISDIAEIYEKGRKRMVWVPKGNLYWSNRILSHNYKTL